jgi:hypothetical protein
MLDPGNDVALQYTSNLAVISDAGALLTFSVVTAVGKEPEILNLFGLVPKKLCLKSLIPVAIFVLPYVCAKSL